MICCIAICRRDKPEKLPEAKPLIFIQNSLESSAMIHPHPKEEREGVVIWPEGQL